MKILIVVIFICIFSENTGAENLNNTTTSISLDKVQDAIEQKDAKWRASESSISKFSLEDQMLLFGGLERGNVKLDNNQKIVMPTIQDLPSIFSWRDNNGDWLTPAKNQQVRQCGSCWAFAAVGLVESWWKITNEEPDSMIDLSEQYLISCSPAGTCAGAGWASHALEWISQYGIPPEDCMPYMASDTVDCESCCENWEEEAVKIPGWSWVTTDTADIVSIKNAVYRQPVISHMEVYEDFLYYSGGVYEHVTGSYIAGHAVLIYGWDDTEQSWLCKNSIGQDWGEEGNFRIKWGNCRIGTQTLLIWDKLTEETPFIVTPQVLYVEIARCTSLDTTVTITNKNSNKLEFTTFVYGNEGTFHPSPYNSYDGSSIWCGDEKLKGYGNWWIKYLDTPVLDLSTTNAPEISCLMKWLTDGDPIDEYDGRDGGNLMISVDGGKNFDLLVPETPFYNCDSMLSHWMYGIPFGMGSWSGMTDWQHVHADLSDYKSDEAIVRFTFFTTDYNCTVDNPAWKGLFIDSLLVKDNSTIIYENQGDNVDNMRRSGIGGTFCPWIKISENPGTIAAGNSIQLKFNLNTTELDTGYYYGSIVLSSNNKYYKYFEIPIKLHVLETTSIHSRTEMIPQKFSIEQNYPNPFNPTTTISYQLPIISHVELSIYSILGQKVATLVSEKQSAGSYKVEWDASKLASGVFIYRLVTDKGFSLSKKLVLLK
jgi:C1A family cysteine protease